MLSRARINQLKEKYPKDTPIELINMEGESRMAPGLNGKVIAVDDIGQIHVEWENGSSLALNVEEDKFRIDRTPQEEQTDQLEQEPSKDMGMQISE